MYKGHSSSPAVCICVLGPWRRGLRLSIFLHVTGSSVCRSDVITLWFHTIPISTLPCVIDFQKKLIYRITLFNFAGLCTMTKTFWFWFFRCQENFKFSPLFAHGCRKKKFGINFLLKLFIGLSKGLDGLEVEQCCHLPGRGIVPFVTS